MSPIIGKAILGSVGLAGTITTVYFVLPKSSNNNILEKEIEINSECINSKEGYDVCMAKIIPDSEEIRKDRQKQEEKNKLHRESKKLINRDEYYEKQQKCGKNHADPKYNECATKLSEEYGILETN